MSVVQEYTFAMSCSFSYTNKYRQGSHPTGCMGCRVQWNETTTTTTYSTSPSSSVGVLFVTTLVTRGLAVFYVDVCPSLHPDEEEAWISWNPSDDPLGINFKPNCMATG